MISFFRFVELRVGTVLHGKGLDDLVIFQVFGEGGLITIKDEFSLPFAYFSSLGNRLSRLECCAERFVEARDEAFKLRELLCGTKLLCFVVIESATSDVLRYAEVTRFLAAFVGGISLLESGGAAGGA